MTALDRKTTELRALVQDMLHQFRKVDAQTANGPHVDLSGQELRLVQYLGDAGPQKMTRIAEYLLLAVNSVTSTVDNLERKRIVRRKRSDDDRRVVHVELTPAGHAIYRAALDEELSLLRKMLAALTVDEQEIFMVLFRKIVRDGMATAAGHRVVTPA